MVSFWFAAIRCDAMLTSTQKYTAFMVVSGYADDTEKGKEKIEQLRTVSANTGDVAEMYSGERSGAGISYRGTLNQNQPGHDYNELSCIPKLENARALYHSILIRQVG